MNKNLKEKKTVVKNLLCHNQITTLNRNNARGFVTFVCGMKIKIEMSKEVIAIENRDIQKIPLILSLVIKKSFEI